MFRPKEIAELRTPMKLFVPTETRVKGVLKKSYSPEGVQIFGNFKSFGGEEKEINGSIVIVDTATIVTWYRPEIVSSARIELESGAKYEIITPPENIEQQNQFMKFKVKRIDGGA